MNSWTMRGTAREMDLGSDQWGVSPKASDSLLPILLLEATQNPERVLDHDEFLAEFCHRVRNRLNSLKLCLYIARRGESASSTAAWSAIEAEYRAIERFIDEFHFVVRPSRVAPISLCLAQFLEEKAERWRPRFASSGRSLELMIPPGSVPGSFDPGQLGQALDALALWRARAGLEGHTVRILAWREDRDLHVVWDEPEATLGRRFDDEEPVSLALPVLGRIVSAHRGTLTIRRDRGFQVRLRWPSETTLEPWDHSASESLSSPTPSRPPIPSSRRSGGRGKRSDNPKRTRP